MFNLIKNKLEEIRNKKILKNRSELNKQRLIGRDSFLSALDRSGLIGNIGCNPYSNKTNEFTLIENATHFAFYEMDLSGNIISKTIVDSSLDAFSPHNLEYARRVWDLIITQFPKHK